MTSENDKAVLFSYKMTHDSGFAPNPYGRALTLATCKPGIRKTKKEKQWVAGWTAERLNKNDKLNPKLIYLMQVKKVLTLEEYSQCFCMQYKIPVKKNKRNQESKTVDRGDNIYYKNEKGDWKQIKNDNHCLCYRDYDTGGENVLIATEFYYFGKQSCLGVMDEEIENLGIKVPNRQSNYGWKTEGENVKKFIEIVEKKHRMLRKNLSHHDLDGNWMHHDHDGNWKYTKCNCMEECDCDGKCDCERKPISKKECFCEGKCFLE